MKYKAVIADVDGTLMEPKGVPAPAPSKRLKKAVSACQKKGVVFSLASGRSLSWVKELIKGLKLTSPIILDNGASIYDCKQKKYIWQSLLPKRQAQKILSILQKDKSLPILVVDGEERLEDLSKISKWKISKIVVLHITPEKAEKLYKMLKSESSVHVTRSISGVNPSTECVHITNHNATKQVAILKLAEFLGISTKEMIGIGDSYNDFPLLLACGLKVAMGNAVADIKEIADYIAPSYEEEGVVDVLNKFIL